MTPIWLSLRAPSANVNSLYPRPVVNKTFLYSGNTLGAQEKKELVDSKNLYVAAKIIATWIPKNIPAYPERKIILK